MGCRATLGNIKPVFAGTFLAAPIGQMTQWFLTHASGIAWLGVNAAKTNLALTPDGTGHDAIFEQPG